MADTRFSDQRAGVGESGDDPASAGPVDIETLTAELERNELPGATLHIEEYKSVLADYALVADDESGTDAHMLWLLILSLRGMGISVDELCGLARKRPQDTLLFGNCELQQHRPLKIGATFTTKATVEAVSRKVTKKGDILDFVTIRTSVFEGHIASGSAAGEAVNGYIFKRGGQ